MISSQTYRPTTLSEVYGQEDAVAYFQSVVRRPTQAPRNYFISGDFGIGKTTIVRAFARDLIGEAALDGSSYLELDSSNLRTPRQLESMLSYIFSEAPGWKVVLFDEVHLLDPQVQQMLLKPLEDFVGEIFFFLATTDPDKVLKPLRSRCLEFPLRSFTSEEQTAYLSTIMQKEGLQQTPAVMNLASFHAAGHLRDLMNQVDLLKVMGEAEYLSSRGILPRAIRDFFRTKGFETIEVFAKYPTVMVRSGLDRFFRDNVVSKKLFFKPAEITKVFMSYLRLKSMVKSDDDFFSMLYLWKESFIPSQIQEQH